MNQSRRFAVIDVAGEFLSSIQFLQKAGIEVRGSMAGVGPDMVRLIVSGDCLPDECERGPFKLVTVTFCCFTEREVTGGKGGSPPVQKLVTKIDNIEVTGEVVSS